MAKKDANQRRYDIHSRGVGKKIKNATSKKMKNAINRWYK